MGQDEEKEPFMFQTYDPNDLERQLDREVVRRPNPLARVDPELAYHFYKDASK